MVDDSQTPQTTVAHPVRTIARVVAFCLILCLIMLGLSRVFSLGAFTEREQRTRDCFYSFYQEEANTLDAVYVGNSSVYSFWVSPIAWNRWGIAAHSISGARMPAVATRYVIADARKTQPNAVYIVNVNSFKRTDFEQTDINLFHETTDNMPLSLNKLLMINAVGNSFDMGIEDRVGNVFAILRYHSTWSNLKSQDYAPCYADVKGSVTLPRFFNKVSDFTDAFTTTDARLEEDDFHPILDDLLAYCKDEGVRILFVRQPQVASEDELKRMNSVCDYLDQEGFDVLDLSQAFDEVGLYKECDFADAHHTNAHGAIKYTDYVAQYLIENYGLQNKHGDDRYASWDEATALYETYMQTMGIFDYELDVARTSRDLKVENIAATLQEGVGASVTWDACPDCDQLIVYRRRQKAITNPATQKNISAFAWERVAVLDRDATSFEDRGLTKKGTYVYAVIPTTGEGDAVTYGSYMAPTASIEWGGGQ